MPAPTTGFEDRNLTVPWTSIAEEDAFLAALDAYSNRLRVETVGTSVEGRPIRMVRIGTGSRKVLHVCLQHGDEPATREAWFTVMRQWADSTDPALLAYLSRVTVLVIPTANPDNLDKQRRTSNNVDPNRDGVAISQPETQTIHRVIRDERPDLVTDWHESDGTAVDYTSLPTRNVNVSTAVRSLGDALQSAVQTAITGAGSTWASYSPFYGPEYLINSAALRGPLGFLLETERDMGIETDAHERHARHLVVADAIWRWHDANRTALATAVDAARDALPTRTDALTLQSGTGSTGPTVTPPNGYFVTVNAWERIAGARDALGITAQQAASGYYVPTAQEARLHIPYLMDPQSAAAVVSGDPMPAVPVSPPPVPIGREVSYFYRVNGRTRPVTLKVKA